MKEKTDIKTRLVEFTVSILHLAKRYENDRTLAPIFNQIIRSAGSIGANVSEASGSVSKNGFAHYFHIALQSANETRYWLDVLQKVQVLDAAQLTTLQTEVDEFVRILRASLRTMRGRGKQ